MAIRTLRAEIFAAAAAVKLSDKRLGDVFAAPHPAAAPPWRHLAAQRGIAAAGIAGWTGPRPETGRPAGWHRQANNRLLVDSEQASRSDTCPPAALTRIAASPHQRLREAAAANPACPPRLWWRWLVTPACRCGVRGAEIEGCRHDGGRRRHRLRFGADSSCVNVCVPCVFVVVS